MEEVSSNATSISIHDDDVNVYGLDGEDDEYGEESKVGTYECEASATNVYDRINRFIVLITSSVYFIFV